MKALAKKKPSTPAPRKTPRVIDRAQPARLLPSRFPREIHWRYVQVYQDAAVQKKSNPSKALLARALGIRRETIGRWERRYPQFSKWVSEQLEARAGHKTGAVILKLTHQALDGNVKAAELVLKVQGRIGRDEPQAGAGNVVIQVIGIPNTAAPGEWVGGYLPDAKR